MSILIKGMETPKSGVYQVAIENSNGKDKTLLLVFEEISNGIVVRGSYELVPVPPHGRLIDADAFIGTIRPLCEEDKFAACTFETVKRLMVEQINNAPTIIEAEEGET